MTEIGFSILRHKDRTPVLARCDRCQLKFLTPVGMISDPQAAHDYLWKKYHDHHCSAIAQRSKGQAAKLPEARY